MNTSAKTGVFLCKCGNHIDPLVDLQALHGTFCQDPDVTHCEIMSYPCQKPGIEGIMQAVAGDVTHVVREQTTLNKAVETQGEESVRHFETL